MGAAIAAMMATTAARRALLELEDLTTGYGDVAVVRGASLAFAEGLITAIIGSNGAGKSTVIKAAAGLLRTWSGRVLIAGEDVTREPGASPPVAWRRLRAAGADRNARDDGARQSVDRRPHHARRRR